MRDFCLPRCLLLSKAEVGSPSDPRYPYFGVKDFAEILLHFRIALMAFCRDLTVWVWALERCLIAEVLRERDLLPSHNCTPAVR